MTQGFVHHCKSLALTLNETERLEGFEQRSAKILLGLKDSGC